MDLEKLLARGIGGWLQFEHACQRGEIFSEKYLSVPIAQILNTKFNDKVHSEIKHPILGDLSPGRGRPPEIDFTVHNNNNEIVVAIESKWIGKSTTKQTVERIIWDLVRLVMIGNNDKISCYFILAGKKKNLTNLFNNKHFTGQPNKKGSISPILSTDPTKKNTIFRIDSPSDDRSILLKPILKLCKDIELPVDIGTSKVKLYPKEAYNYEYQAYVWEVAPTRNDTVFKPSNHSFYKK